MPTACTGGTFCGARAREELGSILFIRSSLSLTVVCGSVVAHYFPAPGGRACCVGAWPPSWSGVLCWCVAFLMVGRAVLVHGPLMVGRAVSVRGPPRGGGGGGYGHLSNKRFTTRRGVVPGVAKRCVAKRRELLLARNITTLHTATGKQTYAPFFEGGASGPILPFVSGRLQHWHTVHHLCAVSTTGMLRHVRRQPPYYDAS